MTKMVVMIPIRTLLGFLAQESGMKSFKNVLKLTFNEPNRNLAWTDNGGDSFRKNITSQARFSTK